MLNAKWIDDIKVNLSDQIVMMKKVLYVFGLNANLFSISAFNRRRFVIIFNEKIVEIRSKGILIVTGIVKGRMYMLQSASTAFLSSEAKISEKLEETVTFDIAPDGADDRTPEKKGNITPEKKGQATFRLWHERLGHVRPARLKMLPMQVLGMDAINVSDDFDCKVCNLSKLTRKVNREVQRRAFRRLKRVHTNA